MWTRKLFFAFVLTYLIFITARGDLPKWKQILTTKSGDSSSFTTTTNGLLGHI